MEEALTAQRVLLVLKLLIGLCGEAAYIARRLLSVSHRLPFHRRAGCLLVKIGRSRATQRHHCVVAVVLLSALVRRLYFDFLIHRLSLGLRQVKRFAALTYVVRGVYLSHHLAISRRTLLLWDLLLAK